MSSIWAVILYIHIPLLVISVFLSQMSKYTLYYFDITGLGEPVRYFLHYCGVPFEDKRLTFEEWPKYKAGNFGDGR